MRDIYQFLENFFYLIRKTGLLIDANPAKVIKAQFKEIAMIARDESFNDMTICLDGATFIGCKFDRCRLTFSGVLAVNLEKNEFNECIWEFSGPAQNTIGFMTLLYSGGAKELIESTFKNIQTGTIGGRRADDKEPAG